MSKQALFVGAIASVIAINSVFADTTVTSRGYVDTEVAKKQDLIETNREYPWHYEMPNWQPEVNLVTTSYNDNNEIVGNEYGILSRNDLLDGYWYGNTILQRLIATLSDDEGGRVIAGTVPSTYVVGEAVRDLDYKKQDKMVCAGWPDGVTQDDAHCWLWSTED